MHVTERTIDNEAAATSPATIRSIRKQVRSKVVANNNNIQLTSTENVNWTHPGSIADTHSSSFLPPLFRLTTTRRKCEIITSKVDKWKQHGITVAGGHGYGDQLNQLSSPQGIVITEKKRIYVADWNNHRIVEWKCSLDNGQLIAGRNGQGNRLDQLTCPTDLVIDARNGSFIIADFGNRRIMRWSIKSKINQQIVISDIVCFGLAIDKCGFIYMSDCENNSVRKWKEGDKDEKLVAGGQGQGNHLHQFNYPTYIFVDENCSLYVSDTYNHRVMKWNKDAKEGVVVAGGNDEGDELKQLCEPRGVIVDSFGRIYVADYGNDRVMRWCEGDEEGEVIVGGCGQGNEPNQLNYPTSLSFDVDGSLYVVDSGNARIQKYNAIFD